MFWQDFFGFCGMTICGDRPLASSLGDLTSVSLGPGFPCLPPFNVSGSCLSCVASVYDVTLGPFTSASMTVTSVTLGVSNARTGVRVRVQDLMP